MGGRYATSGVGLWPTWPTVSKRSANLRRGVYAECTLAEDGWLIFEGRRGRSTYNAK